ncbi:MAG: DEAD/DEAH box helicase family protein [Candidatus Thiodiazotropha sp. (ex Lucina aurantia)]|nr:DEAD/DEAH box helicase family protein [Candidatus Thiodiazotropha sp. (ex Lucina pensylvanica)]MBT3024683.1 DEAD/DEAH box helicase family protein [Candidatus Thiodiazotropha taylori]MBV2098831.1 DEAD/DEAH box helicase family protein [Candidatus Thiodiazotropha sp. (ex Codakia orbicularis)]MBV2103853.1 DEAD/DEAH box helicase family protein [Candidatus Thiodiazotropha sp. (ex Lucina aurantia)]MBV2118276.1 DEAD/DEAH box helicase family protein [Candidatus Thiodiazotropha sp. (ex Lucina aurantia
MDFSKLGAPKTAERPSDPIKIFERLPNLPGTPNDLWRGQADALIQWNNARDKSDVLISLNTGAGKTLVGLLVAQSLVNEGVQNVIYVCATIDLVYQTSQEADRIGLDHTVRVQSKFSNDLFESGRGFCITTYHALFNGLSAIRRRHFPGAVIFDDAHVAESILRSSLTLTVSAKEHPDLFTEVAELFRPHFQELNIEGRFNNSFTHEHPTIVMAAPGGLAERKDRLITLLHNHGIHNNNKLKYSYAHLQDKIERCAILFSNGVFELAPPFLPSLSLDIFERPIRRVYLSATLRSKTDIVRAFGRLPDIVIEPDNDAGNGERLILFGRNIKSGISNDLVKNITSSQKALIAVPSYRSASEWGDLAKPPEIENFSAELEGFRYSGNGAFVLVSRVDGIDLPHDTCRVMVLDGLPSGSSLIERYQWEYLRMLNMHATRIANRLAQLFGRINRGRNDYGAFLIAGNELNAWLYNDRNVALLPQLLQSQILLGRAVQEGMSINDDKAVMDTINAVLSRDPSWLEYYGDNIQRGNLDDDQAHRAEEAEDQMVVAALAEAAYAANMWNGDITEARNILDTASEASGQFDPLLSGWQSIWFGAALEAEGDIDSAHLAYRRAMNRLGGMLVLPRGTGGQTTSTLADDSSPFARNIDRVVGLTINEHYEKEFSRIRSQLSDLAGATTRRMEEATRALGEILGFVSTRPDNDVGTGPDVLWVDDTNKSCIAFELKTDKSVPATYWKKDISQGHDHLAWIGDNYEGYDCLGLLYIGPDGSIEIRANPSDVMWCCTPDTLVEIRNQLYAVIADLRRSMPLERSMRTKEVCDDGSWVINILFDRIKGTSMRELPQRQA